MSVLNSIFSLEKVKVLTLYNVCSVHQGMFNTSEEYNDACGGYHEYIGRCSVHRRDIMSTLGFSI